ncbi:MAG: CoA-binding protein [bacterium]
MSILVDEKTRVLVQGITGREGMVRTQLMMNYGTRVIAGVTPGKGAQSVLGLPVYDTVLEAVEKVGEIDASVIFVPAPLVKTAALEAIDAGIKLMVLVPDRVPIYDVLEIDRQAKKVGARFVGPNTLGLLSVDKGVLGMVGGQANAAKAWFKQGNVGITSRSGGMTSSIAYYLSKSGIGLSTIVHVGGDVVVGMPHPDIVLQFQDDPETHAVVMFGEIGSSQEEQVAELLEKRLFTKPLIAYVGGAAAKSGTRFSHAGAIVEGNRGTYASKVTRLKETGAHIVTKFDEIPNVTARVLSKLN